MTEGQGQRRPGVVEKVYQKGFGFITDEGTGERYWFHATACRPGVFDRLRAATPCTFEIGGRGPDQPAAKTGVAMRVEVREEDL